MTADPTRVASPMACSVSRPPFHRCQYIRISLIRPPSVSQKIAPRASTHSPVRFRRKTHLNSVENQGPAAKISPEAEADLRLAEGHVEPPAPDRVGASDRLGKRRLDEHGVRREYCRPAGRCSAWPSPCRRCRSATAPRPGCRCLLRRHGRGKFLGRHAFQHTSFPGAPRRDGACTRAVRPRGRRGRPGGHSGGRPDPGRPIRDPDGHGLAAVLRPRCQPGRRAAGAVPLGVPGRPHAVRGWLDTISAMHANTVRIYTILPPSSTGRCATGTARIPDRALWLIQGVWTELPPRDDFEDRDLESRVPRGDAPRGRFGAWSEPTFAARPGHAGGRYDADVSPWTLGYIIGREWEPYAVKAYDDRNPPPRRTRPVPHDARGSAMEPGWPSSATTCSTYEADELSTPCGRSPTPTGRRSTRSPHHRVHRRGGTTLAASEPATSTGTTAVESRGGRRRARRQRSSGLPAANPAGWFASYHVYPYYPDFMNYDPGYWPRPFTRGSVQLLRVPARPGATSSRACRCWSSEYGVPSSRGIAHLQPQGWNHGGHDEVEMAAIERG